MKLSEKLRRAHESGDFGRAFEGYAERAEALERIVQRLEDRDAVARTIRLAVSRRQAVIVMGSESWRECADSVIASIKGGAT